MSPFRPRLSGTALCAALLAALPALAQQAPDAGRTLQELRPPQLESPRPSPALGLEPVVDAAVLPGGAQATLTGVRLTGQSVFGEAELIALLGDFRGKRFDLAGLKALAQRITEHYRARGYPFARAFIPQQTLEGGVLEIRIFEGRYGKVKAQGAHAGEAQAYLAGLAPGAVIEAAPLERAVLLLADQPGVTVKPLVRPGKEIGTGDLIVELARTPLLRGEVGLDNHGNRYSGANRARAALRADSPFAFGDQIRGQLIYTDEGLWQGSFAYSLPIGADGLRAQLGYSRTYYELGKDFANLGAHGTADVASLALSYPILRSASANLAVGLAYLRKDLEDRQDATSTRNTKESDVLPLTLQFDRRDAYGLTYGSLTYTAGRLKLDPVLEAADIASNTGTRGRFDKWNLDLARLNTTPLANLSLFGRASLQWAGKNLDSSESFSLGGPHGVRAYPVGEGNGDEGAFAQIEARYRLGNMEPYLFYDAGRVRINAEPRRITPPVADNTRSIAGAGVGLRYTNGPLAFEAVAAWRTRGGRPLSDTDDDNPRLWASLGWQF